MPGEISNKPYAPLTVGPFVGMMDWPSAGAQDATRARNLVNVYSPTPGVNGDLMGRTNFTQVSPVSTLTNFVAFGRYAMTGTVTFTNGSTAVTGVGTLFTTEIMGGAAPQQMALADADLGSNTDVRPVLTVTDDTHLTLVGVWTGTSHAVTGWAWSNATGASTAMFTATADAVVVGDIVTSTQGGTYTGVVTTRTDANHFDTGHSWAATGKGHQTTTTLNQAGIVGGPFYGVWQHTLSTGVYHRLLLALTTDAGVDGTGVGRYRFLDGTNRLRLVEYDPSNATHPFTDRTSTSMNAVALTAGSRIYGLTFNNYFIITDGTNRPRKIDSAWVLTNLTDANYAFYGALWRYYGRIFGIDASDQNTLRWSEVNQQDTGYGTGTSNNSWSLYQTSPDGITGGIGSNQAIFIFRANSMTIITGVPASDFRSSGSVDALQAVGTRSPDSICLVGQRVVWWDQYARPQSYQIGYGLLPLWPRGSITLKGAGKTQTQATAVWGRFDPVTNLVKFGYRASNGSTTNEQLLVFAADTWECFGTHILVKDASRTAIDHGYSTMDPTSSAAMLDQNLLPIHVIASGTAGDLSIYVQGSEDVPATAAQDVLAAGTLVTVQGTVETPLMGMDPLMEKHVERIVAGVRNVGGATTGTTALKVQYRHAYADYSAAQAMAFAGTGAPAFVTYDGATYKVELRGLPSQPSRYMQLKFQNDVTGNPAARFTLDRVTIKGRAADDDPQRR